MDTAGVTLIMDITVGDIHTIMEDITIITITHTTEMDIMDTHLVEVEEVQIIITVARL